MAAAKKQLTRQEAAWNDWQERRARWPKQAAAASGRYAALFKRLRHHDNALVYLRAGETAYALAQRVRAILPANWFTCIDSWSVAQLAHGVRVTRLGPRQ